MPFKKGQSGNPGGRSPRKTKDGRTIAEVARDHSDKAIQTLAEIAEDAQQPAAARVSAANSILDRAWGKSKQPIVGGDEGDSPIQTRSTLDVAGLTDEQLRALASIRIQEG
jgi:hypothetical protein